MKRYLPVPIISPIFAENHSIMSAVTALYHIVINTHRRNMTLPLEASEELYRYIAGVIVGKQSTPYAINGIENHIHILVHLHPSVCLADLVRDIKLASSNWIKLHADAFPNYQGWGKEYGAFSYAMRNRDMVAQYIKRQREHHRHVSFEQEYRQHVEKAGLEWNDYRLT